MSVRKEDPVNNLGRLQALAWIVLATVLVGACVVVPQLVEPGVLPPASVSVAFLWLVSPLAAVAAGKARLR